MARKSRKQIAVEEPVIESVSSEVFSTAIYARLSVENSGKSEKDFKSPIHKRIDKYAFSHRKGLFNVFCPNSGLCKFRNK